MAVCALGIDLVGMGSEALDNRVCEAATAHGVHFGLHESGEVVGDLLVFDRGAQPLGD